MPKVFLYFMILLLIIFLCLNLLSKNKKYSPRKIRMIMTLILILELLRSFTLILMSLIQAQKYLFLLKPLIFLHVIYLPMALIVAFYIFWRNDKVNFNLSFILLGVLLAGYAAAMYFLKGIIQISSSYGYVMSISKELVFGLTFISILTFILFVLIFQLDNSFVNKKGLIFLAICIIIAIFENLSHLCGIYLFPYALFSELAILLITTYSINILKR
ncbi:hypothetical protein CPJCM30710_20790 [Clostridium polyendosporum]|uniref:Uncharacterized protein n=1 Tax=Clostridium polyendosporum TaxID=69208 RepID=A0A919S192_9CLOT|nr:hypothetical protein [Clostridium polyendosporum]GIM29413.1 hypothetical protein CPJCM30710_20790 [Clostridium polyendosporum]